MKHESDDSDIIVYEIRDDYSVGASTKSEKKTDTTEKKDASTPDPDQKQVDAESMAQLGGFSGRVYDKLTHRTIEGVLVAIAKDLSIKTDEKGMFSVVGIKPGQYRITALEDGYVVHSCKGSAVAGETTKLESFHLIPDCLAAQYPESMDYEEDETEEEEVVEFAMESPHATPSEELFEKTIEVSLDVITVGDIPGETVLDLSTIKTIAEEETVKYPENIVDEKVPSIEVEPPKDVIATPEEEVAIAEQPSITECSLSPVDTVIAEAVPPEGVPEKVQEVALETAPQELTVEEMPIETPIEDRTHVENRETVYREPLFEPATEELSEQDVQFQGHQGQLSETEPFVETVSEIIPQEEPPIEASLEEMQTPVIDPDSTEAVTSVPEEVIIKDGPSVEEIPLGPAEITNAETAQSEEAPLVLSIEEVSIATAMEDVALEEIKEAFYREQQLDQFAEDSIEQTVPLPEYQAISLEPFVDIPPEIALQKQLLEKIHEEEPPVETSLEEMQTPVIASDSAEIVIPIPEEIIIGEGPSVEELSFISVEPTYKEQSVEPSTEVIPQTVLQTRALEDTHEEEQPVNISTEEALEHGTVDKDSVTPEESTEDLADYDISSLSDEERAAMSGEENMVEAAGFEGSINAQPNPAFRGLPITITYHLRNVACDDPNDFIIQIIVVNPDTGTIHETFEAPVTCTKNAFSIGGFTFSTASYEAYVYALSMQIVSKKTKSAHLLDGIPLEIKNLF